MGESPVLGLSDWRPLARGGLAVVWEARQRSFDRLVAVKVYQRQLDESGRRRFLREVVALGRLSDHPGIVTAHDAGILEDDRPYLIMELCSGGSLSRWLKPGNLPSEARVKEVGIRIADALAAVNAAGVLHRDIKPANILLDGYGNPRLADFGLVAVAGGEAAAAEALHVTPAYAPPEAFDMQPATASGDVYSLAATLYSLLAGEPFRCLSAPVTLEQVAAAAKKPAKPLTMVDGHLLDVLMNALSIDPAARPTAATFRDQLAEAADQRFPQRRPLAVLAERAPVHRAPARGGTRRVAMATVAALLVAGIASGAALLMREPTTQSAFPAGQPSSAGPSRVVSPGPPAATTPAEDDPARASVKLAAIALQESALAAEPFQTLRIRGTYRDGGNRSLRVQRWEEAEWLAFPLPIRTDQSGRFTAYVELGQPGRHRLRVLDPGSGVASDPLVVVVRN